MLSSLFWKKAWVWIKNYWYVPALLAYTLVLWIFFRRNTGDMSELLDITKESYEKQIKSLNKAHSEEIEKRDKIIDVYGETLKSIEIEYNVRLKDLDRNKRKEIENLSKDYEKDPDKTIIKMKKLFGV